MGNCLIEDRETVADRAFGRRRDHRKRLSIGFYSLGFTHFSEMLC